MEEQERLELRELPEGLDGLLAPYLVRQRWYAGSREAVPEARVVESGRLAQLADGKGQLWWAIVSAAGNEYQVVIGDRPASCVPDHVRGPEDATLGAIGDDVYFDAIYDNELALALFEAVTAGHGTAQRARPLGAEQSNTSVVYDDRVILKLFRRLPEGANLDVEVTTALAAAGFAQIAQPVARWQHAGRDLAFCQQYLAGGTDGWALALTSLRDYYGAQEGGEPTHPGLSGGDFAAEVCRLGQVTAEMHLAMADAFGVSQAALAEDWPALMRSIESRLSQVVPDRVGQAGPLLDRLRAVRSPGPAVTVHGDYHLGQVMRTDTGWYVLDFEGEPNRGMEERRRQTSPLKDVAGMLRSLQYASRFALGDRAEKDTEAFEHLARAWEDRNRAALMRGYYDTKGIEELLPSDVVEREAVRVAFELDKALYEVGYEEAYRPAWVGIPRSALERMLSAPLGKLLVPPADSPQGEDLGTAADDELPGAKKG